MQDQKIYRINESFVFNPHQNTIRGMDGVEQLIEPMLSQVMLHLIESSPETVTHATLIEKFWGPTVNGREVLMKTISKIRRLYPTEVISTVSKVGYRWVGKVEPVQTPIRSGAKFFLARFGRFSTSSVILVAVILLILKAIFFPHGHGS